MIANLSRLREQAIRHGVAWDAVELDPATVNGLLDVADAARAFLAFPLADGSGRDQPVGWYQARARLEEALSVFEEGGNE